MTIPTISWVPIGQAVSEEKIFKTFFLIGSYVRAMSVAVSSLGCPDGVIGHNSERGSPKEYSIKVWSQ